MESGRQHGIVSALLGFAVAFGVVHWLLPARDGDAAAGLMPELELPVTRTAEALEPGLEHEEPAEPAVVDEPDPVAAAAAAQESSVPAKAEGLPDGLVLYGRVVDSEGAPLDEAFVSVRTAQGENVYTKSDEEGRYTLGVLPLDIRRVIAGKRDYHEHDVELPAVAEPGLLRQDFLLRPKQIVRVRLLTSAGEAALPALREAGVNLRSWSLVPVATRSDPGDTFDEVTGSLNNYFGIGTWWDDGPMGKPDLGPEIYGTVTLHEDGPAWLSLVAAHQVLRKQPIDPSTEEVTLTLDPEDLRALQCGLSARMIDARSGAPLAGWFWVAEDPFAMRKGTAVEEDGGVFVDDALPGNRYLILRAEGRAELVLEVELTRGERLELGDLLLHPPIALKGEVKSEAGDPIEARLRWGRLDPATGEVAWVRQRSAASGPDGTFELGGLIPDHWVVQVEGLPAHPPRPYDPVMASAPVRVDATGGSVSGIELVVEATTAVTFVVEGAEEPWPYVRALDAANLPARSAWLGRWDVETPLYLPPGAYELVFSRDGVELERRPLVVESEPQRIEWSAPGG